MEAHDFFLTLLIILLTARIFAELATRLQAPSVIGELFAGVVLGPSLLGWIEPTEAVRLMAGIGIILLLFEVGLETDVKRLVSTGLESIVVALAGFILPFLFGFGLAYGLFELPLLVSLFIGGTLTATSIGITVRVLGDLKRQHSKEGQIVLGAAVLDDVMGVVLLALLYEFSIGGGVSLVNTGKVLIFVAAFFVLAPAAAKLMSMVIKRFDATSEIPGLIPTTIVSLVLFFAWLAHAIGAPELLGGFAAGLALSRRFFPAPGRCVACRRGLCGTYRNAYETHCATVHADLLCHGGTIAEPARDRLEFILHLVVLPVVAGRRCCRETLRGSPVERELACPLDDRHGDDSARRSRAYFRRAWQGERDLQQRGLRRHGHRHRPDHVAAALCHEVVLRALWSADAVVDCCLDAGHCGKINGNRKTLRS